MAAYSRSAVSLVLLLLGVGCPEPEHEWDWCWSDDDADGGASLRHFNPPEIVEGTTPPFHAYGGCFEPDTQVFFEHTVRIPTTFHVEEYLGRTEDHVWGVIPAGMVPGAYFVVVTCNNCFEHETYSTGFRVLPAGSTISAPGP